MDPVDEFARLKEQIKALEDRVQLLRADFLKPGARLRSNSHEVVVRHQKRRVFQKDRLPQATLDDPRFWAESTTELVSVRPLEGARTQGALHEDDLVVIEPFDLPPPARAFAAPLPRPSGGAAA